jgi:hypothetical protein
MSTESECKEVIGWFKDAIKAIIKNHYGDVIKVDFDNLTICIDDRCAKYNTYQGMLLALAIIDHAIRMLPDGGVNPSEKSLNTTLNDQGHAKERRNE